MPNDDELERYLSEFSPRAVRPLDVPRPVVWPWLKPMAAAAVVLACAGSAVWYGRRATTATFPAAEQISYWNSARGPVSNEARPNLYALTRLALEDDTKFESELEKESRAELPGFDGPESGLSVLAKEESQ